MKKKSSNEANTAVLDAPRENGERLQTAATVPAMGEYKIVPHMKVRPDPNQPRKTFNEEKLEELAESIRLNGVISPLVVRHMPAKLKIEPPDLIHEDWQVIDDKGAVVVSGNEGMVKMFVGQDAEEFYQIIFGERRWRAAKIAGLNELPVIVRELTDREIFQQQFVENNQRENLTLLEEARTFQDRIAKEKETDPAFNADKLAEILGIARATVYNRLTLMRLTAPVLEALEGGKIQTTVAGLIAMIPDPKQQEKLLKEITNEESYYFPFSFRDVEEIIEEEYCKQLKDAPFNQKDTELMHEMCDGPGNILYGGPCATCVARTGNMKAAFPHIKNLNVCTKPECFQKKCLAHFGNEAAEAERKGQKVLTAKEFKKVKSQYAAAGDRAECGSSYYDTWNDVLGKKIPEPTVVVVTEEGVKSFIPKESLQTAAEAKGVKDVRGKTAEDRAKQEEEQKAAQAQRERRRNLVVESAPDLLKCLGKLSDKLAWELAGEMVASLDWLNSDMEEVLIDQAKGGGKVAVLARCFADGEAFPVSHTGEWNKNNVALWKRAGVDLVAEEKKREKEAPPALPLEKAKPQQKELLAVKKNKKPKKK